MNSHIFNTEVQQFIGQHLDDDLTRLILKGSPFQDVTIRELAEQIESKRKCRSKLPTWFNSDGIYYPNKLNIEQTSSERTAEFKASLISGNSLLDLTGGLGVDSYYFSKRVRSCDYCEIQPELFSIAQHNFNALNVTNIKCSASDGIKFLKQGCDVYDWIYIDPSRRSKKNDKVFLLKDCSPDLESNLDLILDRAQRVMVKLSPFLDISLALNQLNSVEEVYVVALDNEVKELLFILRKNTAKKPIIRAVNLKKDKVELISTDDDQTDTETAYGPVKNYLYEPNAAILKAGLFNLIGIKFKLYKLHPNSHLYSSDKLVEFPGRRFLVVEQFNYQPKKIKRLLGFDKANITTRNFKESVHQIRKRTGIKEGGDEFLFFTTDFAGQSKVIHCRKTI